MGNVIKINTGLHVGPAAVQALHQLENDLCNAIATAKLAELPQGFIVALLHAYAAQQTASMLEGTT
jgi:hypothetical protein